MGAVSETWRVQRGRGALVPSRCAPSLGCTAPRGTQAVSSLWAVSVHPGGSLSVADQPLGPGSAFPQGLKPTAHGRPASVAGSLGVLEASSPCPLSPPGPRVLPSLQAERSCLWF